MAVNPRAGDERAAPGRSAPFRTGKPGRFVLMGILYAFVAVMLLGYCYMLAMGLGVLGLARLIPLYALTISSLVTIFFTFLKANGSLFGCRDHELITAAAGSDRTVITSRFAVLYLFNFVFSLGCYGGYGSSLHTLCSRSFALDLLGGRNPSGESDSHYSGLHCSGAGGSGFFPLPLQQCGLYSPDAGNGNGHIGVFIPAGGYG